ncbi:MAG: hypothetical protein EBS62_13890 [Betaproteobacteria bacterium]|nr:hypothetical protein [Betaproteobacteria bacterium]
MISPIAQSIVSEHDPAIPKEASMNRVSMEKIQFDGLSRPQYVVMDARAHAKSGKALKGLVTEHVDHATVRHQHSP